MAAAHLGFTGVSSDAMVAHAFGWEQPIPNWNYPHDRGDWRRCLLAYAMAPQTIRDRMRPTMRAYRAHLSDVYLTWRRPVKYPTLAEAVTVVERRRA